MADRPIPQARGEERRYFADLREHRMPYYRCGQCAAAYARPRERCASCGGVDVARHWSSGEGTVYSFTSLHRAGHPFFADVAPYTIALVEFSEGFRSLADLIMPPHAEAPYIGQRVRVEFEDVTTDVTLAHFVVEEKA